LWVLYVCFHRVKSDGILFGISPSKIKSDSRIWFFCLLIHRTPEDPEYLSEDSDNYTKNQCLSNGDSHESIDGIMEFNISYHKATQSSNKDMPNGITYVTQPLDVPGYAFMVDRTMSLPKSDDEHPPLQVSDDGHLNIDFTGEMLGAKKLRKTMSHPANGALMI
jgi:hypothetical protein